MADTSNIYIPKLSIIYPGGDQMTSVLLEKEKDTVIGDLLQRLCTLRAIDYNKLKAKDEVGKRIDTSLTVGASGLVFIELLEKGKKKAPEKKKEKDVIQLRGRPQSVQIKSGEVCNLPLRDQLFEDEIRALEELKKQCEITKYYSEEFLMACLFARKFDLKRTVELLETNLKWRRANNLMTIPSCKDFELFNDLMAMNLLIPGARDKEGSGLSYIIFDGEKQQLGKEPWTIPTMKRWFAWFYFVGIFHDGIDSIRNGIVFVEDLRGFGWKNFDVDFQKQMSSMWVDTFPMRLKKILILNPPAIFGAIMKICKTFMKSKMLDRMEVVDKAKDLKKWATEEHLPTQFGGTLEFTPEQWRKLLIEWAEINEERLRAPGRE